MAYPVLEFDPPPKKREKRKRKIAIKVSFNLIRISKMLFIMDSFETKIYRNQENKRIRNLVSEEIEKNWSILKKNIRQKDI